MPEISCPETTMEFAPNSELFLFTDGLYELLDPNGGRGSFDEFLAALEQQIGEGKPPWDAVLSWLDRARAGAKLDDDVTLLRFATRT